MTWRRSGGYWLAGGTLFMALVVWLTRFAVAEVVFEADLRTSVPELQRVTKEHTEQLLELRGAERLSVAEVRRLIELLEQEKKAREAQQ